MLFFFCLLTFIGFQCSIMNTPCNFERFCIGNSTYSNCHNKVVIFSSHAHALYGMSPTPHAKMPMMPNNMLEVKHTNEGCRTFYIYCTCVWNSSYLDYASFVTRSKAFFSFHFCFAYPIVQNTNIHKNVVLSPKTPRMSRWMPRFTQLHLKAMILVWMSMK
jgi:hypothetical protein